MESHDTLISGLPDPAAASRFLDEFSARFPRDHSKLERKAGLLSDVLTLAAFSPLLATALLQNPEHIWWLERKRKISIARSIEDLLESFGRFSLVNSQLEPQVLFARFRRRELLRIYLRDIRRLAGIAEITEEISNLADAILESALKLARSEMDKRYGLPQETAPDGRLTTASVCIAALGKLGSRELNYSSDIDLLFIYSAEGETAGGSRGQVTNREYFVKIAEQLVKLVGSNEGEGAAYRVDLRLRPHGRLGALATSVEDMVRYYKKEARAWERQVMIRSRGCAGDVRLFRSVFSRIAELVFDREESVESALGSVRRSKEAIDRESPGESGYNVKLGRGGIREIEFIAQALQLAHGGHDRWLRSPHTLISLARLSDRGYLTKTELTELSEAYEFLRRTEHILQMENGLQTHTVPDGSERRALLAKRIGFAGGGELEPDLEKHTDNVSRVFSRVFESNVPAGPAVSGDRSFGITIPQTITGGSGRGQFSPHLSAMLDASPQIAGPLSDGTATLIEVDPTFELMNAIEGSKNLRECLSALRRSWQNLLLPIAIADRSNRISVQESKRRQTELAEASIAAALKIAADQLNLRYGQEGGLALCVLALGKLGGRGVDYESDLDLLFIYDEEPEVPIGITHAEYYARVVELFITTLSSVTRDGSLYRVDLRLRPYGGKGLTANPKAKFLDYMRVAADIWELLAFVKLRAVGGELSLAREVENETRRIIHGRALALDKSELARETRRVRVALEKQRSRTRRGEVDIKYGAGGMLDIYFTVRYLQLRDNIPDDPDRRSTRSMLDRLYEVGSLSGDAHMDLAAGYEFLSKLDHYLRLTVGRTTRLPDAANANMTPIAARMGFEGAKELFNDLALHRLSIRERFCEVLENVPI